MLKIFTFTVLVGTKAVKFMIKFSDFNDGLKVYLILNFDEFTESEIDKLSGDNITLNSSDIILKNKKIIIDKIEIIF